MWSFFKVKERFKENRLNSGSLLHISQPSMTCQSKNHNNTFLACQGINWIQRSILDVNHINPCRQPTWKYTSISASFLFPRSLSLLGQKIWLQRLESAHENIMSKHGSEESLIDERLGGGCAAQSHHTLQSKAPNLRRSLSPWNTAAASSLSCLLLLSPPPLSFCPSN